MNGQSSVSGGRGMEYVTAKVEMADAIRNILHTTIRTVYPQYYPKEVVDFFADIIAGNML